MPAEPAAVAELSAPRRSLVGGLLKQTPAWAISMLVHVIVLLSMALVVNEVPKPEAPRMITASAPEVEENFEEFEEEMRKKWEKVVRVEMGAMKGCLRAVLQMMSRTS